MNERAHLVWKSFAGISGAGYLFEFQLDLHLITVRELQGSQQFISHKEMNEILFKIWVTIAEISNWLDCVPM